MEHIQIRADTDILSDDFFKRILAESWKDNQILEADYTSLCGKYANEIEQTQGAEKADIFCDKAIEKWQEYTEQEKQAGKNIVCEKGIFKAKAPPQIEAFTADELLQMDLPELKTVVEDILKIGVTVLSAKSKMYKSWMCLQMGIAVATGTEFLGKKTVKSDVLYIDLENDRRLSKERLLKLLAGNKPPNNLFIVNDVPTMEDGFTKAIETFISIHPDIHLLIIDIFAKIKYQKKSNQNDYDCDYKSISELKKLAEQYDLAIILVSHNRKMTDDTDAFTNIMGSTALIAPSDQTKTGGAALTLSSKKPTRTGYSFKNWTASIGGTYNPGDSYTHDQDGGTVTMKANWTPWKHTIHYDANGGSGVPSNQTKTYGSALTLSSTKPTKAGYTFKGWTASIGGTYQPGGSYTHDQNGGTVTMKAKWADETKPGVSSFTAVPNYWSAGNGTVTLSVQDKGSGIASIVVERYSNVTKTWTTVKSWTYSGETSVISKSFSETQEGVYYYKLTVKDVAGNVSTSTTNWIYLDHSNPVITGLDSVPTDWVRVAPVISVSATDYLTGTSYQGSGPASVKIQDDAGKVVASGAKSANYTLAAKYEGIHTWTITAKDAVGHTVTKTVTTKYDCTPPGIDGTEVTYVKPDGTTVSGYCQDNIINQHIDDETSRSVNSPNASSGLKSVILYRVKGTNREVIYSDRTKKNWTVSDTHSSFDMNYEITADEKMVSYYELIVIDFAGNRTTKRLTSQYSLLSWFHTSIDRSSYR